MYGIRMGLAKMCQKKLKRKNQIFKILTKLEGIIPALESSHAISYGMKLAKKYSKEDSIIVCLSGRGDKDIETILNME